jgi:hypothetical protein
MLVGGGNLIPISEEQAKLLRELVSLIKDAGGYAADVLGDLPKDLVGLLAGDRVKAWRAERLGKLWDRTKKRLKAQGIEEPEQPSPKLALPILAAAADENSEELQNLWERLLAAAMNPDRAKRVRLRFVEAARRLDPVDALVFEKIAPRERVEAARRGEIAQALNVSRDEVNVSIENLVEVGFLVSGDPVTDVLSPFGREFWRTIQD